MSFRPDANGNGNDIEKLVADVSKYRRFFDHPAPRNDIRTAWLQTPGLRFGGSSVTWINTWR